MSAVSTLLEGTLRAEPRLAGVRVSGLVYDVATGLAAPVGEPAA